MFTKWSKGAVLLIGLLSVFIFTVTISVSLEPVTAWAETSEEVIDDASDAAESSGGFFSSIINWVTGVTDAVNKMWGMENGSGVAMVVNAAFYLLLITGVIFGGKMIFNIVKDTIGGRVDEKYEKPSFRKK